MKDIVLDKDELKVDNGDFCIEDSDNQHVNLIFEATKGSIREEPLVGFGAMQKLKSNHNPRRFTKELKEELSQDGYNNAEITPSLDGTQLNIDVK